MDIFLQLAITHARNNSWLPNKYGLLIYGELQLKIRSLLFQINYNVKCFITG